MQEGCKEIENCEFFKKYGNRKNKWYLDYCSSKRKSQFCIRIIFCKKITPMIPVNVAPDGKRI